MVRRHQVVWVHPLLRRRHHHPPQEAGGQRDRPLPVLVDAPRSRGGSRGRADCTPPRAGVAVLVLLGLVNVELEVERVAFAKRI